MSVSITGQTVYSGSIFYYDTYNVKSYVGEPTVNYNYSGGNPYDPWTVRGTNTIITDPSRVGPVTNARTWKFEKTASAPGGEMWNGWESTYGNIWTGTAGDIWTTSYWYKTSAAAGITNFGIGGFFTSDWSRQYSGTILANVSSIIADGQWHYNYTTTQINENYTNAIIVDGPSWGYSNNGGELYINGLQWEKKSHATPFAAGTRSNTQGLLDLVGTSTLELTNAEYNASGSITFNGSSNYIIASENPAFNTQTPSVEVWIKTNATTQNGFWFEKGQVNTQYSLFQEGSVIQWRQNIGGVTNLSTTTANYISTSNWAHVVGTYTSGARKLYINGVLVNSDAQSGTINTNTNGISIGAYGGYNGSRGYYYNGQIGMVRVYNRVLSADEVLKNYNISKARYGL